MAYMRVGPRIAQRPDLLPQGGRILAALRPPRPEVRFVRCEDARARRRLGTGRGADELAHGRAGEVQATRDRGDAQALAVQPHHLLMAGVTTGAPHLPIRRGPREGGATAPTGEEARTQGTRRCSPERSGLACL